MRRRRTVLLAFGAALIGMALNAVTPLIVRDVVDNVILDHRQSLLPWVIAMLVIGAARFGFGFIRRYEGGRLAVDVQYDMRCVLRCIRHCSASMAPSRTICRPVRW